MESNLKLDIITNILKVDDINLLNSIDLILKNQKRLTIEELSNSLLQAEDDIKKGRLTPHSEINNLI